MISDKSRGRELQHLQIEYQNCHGSRAGTPLLQMDLYTKTEDRAMLGSDLNMNPIHRTIGIVTQRTPLGL